MIRMAILRNHPRKPGSAAGLERLGWLLACIAVGALVGVVGSVLTGSDLWYLAVPVAIAAVWMFVADPTQCEPARRGRGRARGH